MYVILFPAFFSDPDLIPTPTDTDLTVRLEQSRRGLTVKSEIIEGSKKTLLLFDNYSLTL